MGEVAIYVALAVLIYIAGQVGFNAGKWSFKVFTFLIAPIAGLLFGMAVLNLVFPGLSFLRQLVIAFSMTTATVLVSLLLLKLMQPRR